MTLNRVAGWFLLLVITLSASVAARGQDAKACPDGSAAPCKDATAKEAAPADSYTPEARKAKIQGTMILDVNVSAEGWITDAVVEKGFGYGLDEKALEIVKKWKMRPAKGSDGKPVAARVRISVTFKLPK